MSGSDPDREYKFLNLDKLYAEDVKPINMTAVQALEEALLDIIQLSEMEGVTHAKVDAVLRKIIDARAERTRARFTVHQGEKDPESETSPRADE